LSAQTSERHPAGAKAQYLFCWVYGPAEAVPLLQSDSSPNFSASCEVVPFQNIESLKTVGRISLFSRL